MKCKGWNKIASIYIGTIIGAGFASGQEIIQFFSIYGYKGLYGICIATLLFSVFGGVVLNKVYQSDINGFEDLIMPIFGKCLGRAIEVLITLFLFTGFCVMVAGSGAIFNQQFNISYNFGIYLMSISAFMTFMFSIRGISAVNSALVPMLLIGIISMGLIVIFKEGLVFSNYHGAEITKTGNWLTSAVLYVSYNSISSVVIMTSLLSIIPNNRSGIIGGILGGIGLGVIAVFIIIPTLILYSDISNLEIPMLKIANSLGRAGSLLYTFILWSSMFTTAIANGFGCVRRISYFTRIDYRIISIVFCIVSIPLAKIGFANLVINLYPIFGYLGLFVFITVLFNLTLKKVI